MTKHHPHRATCDTCGKEFTAYDETTCGECTMKGDTAMNTTNTVQTAATEALAYFHKNTRADGTDYWYLGGASDDDSTPEWLTELVWSAHNDGDYMPDDYRYRFIVEALSDYAENADATDVYPEADVYTHDLLLWLASNLMRTEYVDAIIDEHAGSVCPNNITGILQYAQYEEKDEVYRSVWRSLEYHADNLNAED